MLTVAPYPDNVRKFVTQKSVKLGETGYDVEVEIVRGSDIEVVRRHDRQIVSVGLKEYTPLPPMDDDDVFALFDLGTVLDVDEVRFADPQSAHRLPVECAKGHRGGPVRVPTLLKGPASVCLSLRAGDRPFGTLTVSIGSGGNLADTAFTPERKVEAKNDQHEVP